MRPGNRRAELLPRIGPDEAAQPFLEVAPSWPHDRFVKRDQWLGVPVLRPARPEGVFVFDDQAAVLEHVEGVSDVRRLAADVAGDAPRRPLPLATAARTER